MPIIRQPRCLEFKGILVMLDLDKHTVARNTTARRDPPGARCYSVAS